MLIPLLKKAWPSLQSNLQKCVALKGKQKKCVVLDLDNTLWGGVIGDDGVDGIELDDHGAGWVYWNLQQFYLSLKERGIILAVCSKNEEKAAKIPFVSHPKMVLKLDDIAVFVAQLEQ